MCDHETEENVENDKVRNAVSSGALPENLRA